MAKQDKRLIDILILNFCLDGIYNKGIATSFSRSLRILFSKLIVLI